MLHEVDGLDLLVTYSKKQDEVLYDPDFQRNIIWDIPLTDGYNHESFEASTKQGLAAMIDFISDFNPTAILVYGWNFPGHFRVMRHFHRRVPVWFRGDSTLLDPMPIWKKLLRKTWLTFVYRHVDKAFFVGHANKRYFQWAGLTNTQLVHAPHAVDNAFFMKDDDARRRKAMELQNAMGIEPEATVILFAGKLEKKKQPIELGRALVSLGKIRPNKKLHLVYAGSGELSERMKSEFAEFKNIHFMGFINQSQMPVYYRMGDFICLPSKGPGETWGLAVNEAMASGCTPIVSDRVGCGEDLVKDPLRVLEADKPEEWHLQLDEVLQQTDISLPPERIIKEYTVQRICSTLVDHL